MKHIVLFGTWCLFFLSGCESSIASDPCDDYVTLFEQESDYISYENSTSTPYFIHHLDNGCQYQIDYTIERNITSKLWALVTNPSTTTAATSTVINASSAPVAQALPTQELRHPASVVSFNTHPPKIESVPLFRSSLVRANTVPMPTVVVLDANETIYLNEDASRSITVTSKVVHSVLVGDKNITLNILLQDSQNVSQDKLDLLASKFLQAGEANDIYDWTTSIVGVPWGDRSNDAYIPAIEAQAITIVIYDMGQGYLGYFYSKDNYENGTVFSDGELTGSNERIMFYLNSRTFGDSRLWPDYVVSTLGHEFQHVVQFYQKQVVRGTSIEVWEDEMASMMIEDLFATKLGVKAPSTIRIPDFNLNPSITVARAEMPFGLEHYATSYAYGAYLLRNYGGAAFLQKMVQNKYGNRSAVNDAFAQLNISKSFEKSLEEFGVAVLLSDMQGLPDGYQFNQENNFTSNFAEVNYTMGSINFYSFGSGPDFNKSSRDPASNNYYEITPPEAKTTRNFLLPRGSKLTIIGR